MITGDIIQTAQSIASKINIVSDKNMKERSMTGQEFSLMKEDQQKELLQKVIEKPSGLVFSRAEPAHKR